MLRSLKSILGYSIHATDGDIGKISNIYFDDQKWIIRYLVVETGSWLLGRKVLLSPVAFVPADSKPEWVSQSVPVFLTKEEIKQAPAAYTEQTVSRENEIELSQYYNWPYYWEQDPFLNQGLPYAIPQAEEEKKENHLRSSKEVIGYYIEGTDGDIGHVEDIIFDDQSWNFLYLVVDTGKILPGEKVLLPLLWIKNISWPRSKVKVDLDVKSIKNGPKYDPTQPINRKVEEVLYDFHGRPKYWVNS